MEYTITIQLINRLEINAWLLRREDGKLTGAWIYPTAGAALEGAVDGTIHRQHTDLEMFLEEYENINDEHFFPDEDMEWEAEDALAEGVLPFLRWTTA